MGEFRQGSATQKGALVFGLLLLAACVAPTSQLPTVIPADTRAEAHKQLVISIRQRDAQAQRLARVAVPILAANTNQCGGNVRRRAGVYFVTAPLNTSSANIRAIVEARGLSRAGEVRVAYTIPGLPADGILVPGDVVTRINGVSAYGAASGTTQVNLQAPVLNVRVSRNGRKSDVSVPTVPVCSYRVFLAVSDQINALAGNNTIVLTTAIVRLMVSDRDLALVFSHELAHLTRNHQDAKKTNATIGAMIAAVVSGLTGVNVVDIGAKIGAGAYSQEFESEADYAKKNIVLYFS